MDKIGFVILHYYTIDDTKKCVDSIQNKIDTDNYEIVIVDNASPNNTGKELKEIYKNNDKIHIILNDENLGFSRGNNIGYRYLKNELKCNFIVMLNNDTYLIQNDFFSVILKEYQKSKFGVMGPKIYLKDNRIDRIDRKIQNVKELKKYRYKIYFKLCLNYLHLEDVFMKINKKNKKNKLVKEEVNEDDLKRCEGAVLHGCCLVFSPIYISKFDGLSEKTFLYAEEDLLYIQIYMNDMITVYNPELKIFHNELSSTKAVTKSNNSKNRFRYKNLIKANKILEKELKLYYKYIKEKQNA